jgi:hypothetical protein
MRNLSRLASAGIAALNGCSIWGAPARAEWLYDSEDNAFGADIHMVMAADDLRSGYVAAIRCSSATDLTLMLLTPEDAPAGSAERMNTVPVQLLVVVDDQDRRAFAGRVDVSPTGSKLRVSAEGPHLVEIVRMAKNAKRRFALAAEIGGKVYHPKTFSIKGARNPVARLETACKLP